MTEDEEIQAAQRKAEKLAADQVKNDARAVMSTHEGRRFAWYLLSQAGIYRSSYSSDPLAMAYNEGQRNNGLQLMALLTAHCPEQYAKMANEQTENEGINQ